MTEEFETEIVIGLSDEEKDDLEKNDKGIQKRAARRPAGFSDQRWIATDPFDQSEPCSILVTCC